ncbi:ketopantoate reductase family protein [Bhargavaea beijingensis]|uniref:2-dehydropantoate 2-reductase n=1 Tax=Bhargavaea beijingensis TaxID=426756 RepID=A0A1G7A5X2_9BACL|nr:ketopantoate reductase family protein [Bhargavaea beijingensis]RSK35574.1 ketopantoate reductase family protein [Bhargavaea beijingensis]SDE10190.1 2-dehydropantoate 2-reductase [Bhargavaea beijingensis]
MTTIRTAALIGLGAIGAAYAERLQKHLKHDFFILADEGRITRYKELGIRVNGRDSRFRYKPLTSPAESAGLIVFGVKNDQLDEAIDCVRPFVGPETILLPLLNGISSEEELKAAFPDNPVLYAMCVGIDAQRDGRDIRYSKLGQITFGTRAGEYPEAEAAVEQLFRDADVPYDIPDDIWREMWWKFMINVGVNQTSSVLRAPYGIFQTIHSARSWMEEVMNEVVQVSRPAGVGLNDRDIARFRPVLDSLSPEGKTSMLQDIEHGRKTEVEYLAGKMVELGGKYGVPVPENEQLLKVIRILEKM